MSASPSEFDDRHPDPPGSRPGSQPGSQSDAEKSGQFAESSRPMMRLDDVLKRAGWVGTGGQAKVWIQDGQVSVNGVIETRRRKQLVLGDVVEAMGQRLVLEPGFFD
jgi:ribosome-associated protein